jgi:hypothetical protein
MAFDIYTFVTPAAGLKAGDAVVLAYKVGRGLAEYRAAGAHFAAGPQAMLVTAPGKFTVVFGGGNITVTWNGPKIASATKVQFQFEAVDGPLDPATGRELAFADGSNIDLAALGLQPQDSPHFTGVPTSPTAAPGTNTTQIANTAFVAAAIAALINSSPAALDTLAELATALGNDANFTTTITNALAAKAALASPALTGTPTAPTAAGGTNTTQLATTAFVTAAIAALNLSQYATKDFAVAAAAAL